MSLTVFGVAGSPYVRSALLALEEKGVAYEFDRMGFQDVSDPAWRERHPFGRLPAFEHDGFRLYETAPFLRYVDQAFPGPSLQPLDARLSARMNQQMSIVDWYVMPQVTQTIGFQRIVAPLIGMATDEDACRAAMPNAQRAIRAIVELIPEGAPFLVGPEVTLADLMLAPHVDLLSATPEGSELLAGSPLQAWLTRMSARPSMAKTDTRTLKAAER